MMMTMNCRSANSIESTQKIILPLKGTLDLSFPSPMRGASNVMLEML